MDIQAMEVASGRYIQSENAIQAIGEEVRLFGGKKAYLLGSPKALQVAQDGIMQSLREAEIDWEIGVFSGFCTYENARKHAEQLQKSGCDCIVGIGGGKCIDTAKATAIFTSLPLGTVPTSLATCVACTNMAIMYQENGHYIGPTFPAKPIVFTLVDLSIIKNAPIRYIASGIADSMAKYPELCYSQRMDRKCITIDDAALQAAYGIAREIWDTLLVNGYAAYQDNEAGKITPTLSAVAHTNLISTGISSGLARGSKQLAMAHAVYNHSTIIFPDQWRQFMHGEIVAVGILLQAYYNHMDEKQIAAYLHLAGQMHVPTSLRQIGIEKTGSNQDKLFQELLLQYRDLSEEKKKYLRECIERIA